LIYKIRVGIPPGKKDNSIQSCRIREAKQFLYGMKWLLVQSKGITLIVKCFGVVIACLLISNHAYSQQETADTISEPIFFLALDGYLRYATTEATSLTSPALDHNQLNLGWFSAGASHAWGRAGVSGKLAFGPRAQQFYDDGGINGNIREAFAYFNLTAKIRLNAGLFPAFYGYEADDPYDNALYSNSWTYTLAPACPAGIQLEIILNEEWSLMLGRYNEVFSRFNPNRASVYGGYINYTKGDNNFVLSTLIGTTTRERKIFALDLTANYALSERTEIGTELVYQPFRNAGEDWARYYSAGLYLTHDLNDKYQLALRGELLDDTDGFNFAPGSSVVNGTIALSRIFGAMKVFGEVRFDGANQAVLSGGEDEVLAGLIGFAYLL